MNAIMKTYAKRKIVRKNPVRARKNEFVLPDALIEEKEENNIHNVKKGVKIKMLRSNYSKQQSIQKCGKCRALKTA